MDSTQVIVSSSSFSLMENSVTGDLILYIQQHESCVKHKIDPEFVSAFAFTLDSAGDFPINVDLTLKWLGNIRRDHVKENLLKDYTENIDYIILKEETGKKPREIIMLSVDCFKLLCMNSHTDLSKQVRRYFMIMEAIAKEYMSDKFNAQQQLAIQDAVNEATKVAKAENARLLKQLTKNPFDPNAECVYIIKTAILTDDREIYKIGRTTNMKQRESVYNTHNADKVVNVYEKNCADSKTVEFMFKRFMKEYSYTDREEYFGAPLSLLIRVFEMCIESVHNIRPYIINSMTAYAQGEPIPEVTDRSVYNNPVAMKRAGLITVAGKPKAQVKVNLIMPEEYLAFINSYFIHEDNAKLSRRTFHDQLKLSPLYARITELQINTRYVLDECIKLMQTTSIDDSIQNWRLKEISVQQFINDVCVLDDKYEIFMTPLFDAYKKYCNDRQIITSRDVTKFRFALEEAGHVPARKKNTAHQGYKIKGLSLKCGNFELFVEQKCIIDDNKEVNITPAYSAYVEFCKEKGEYSDDRKVFEKKMSNISTRDEYNHGCIRFLFIFLKPKPQDL